VACSEAQISHAEKGCGQDLQGKFSDGLKKLGLHNRAPAIVWKKKWGMDIKPVGSGKEALKYLTPYIFRVAISNKNILDVNDRDVTFQYRNRKSNTPQIKTLPAEKFMGQFLQHVLPKGFQKVRTFGLYHPKQRHKLKLVKEQLQPKDCEALAEKQAVSDSVKAQLVRFICPCCHVDMVRIGKIINKRGPPL